jgi:WD40 repeat protein/tetratricopeptide (TPR) repeat protein
MSTQRPNPFPGLRPFRSDEHHLFFGREAQTAALLQLLRTNRFLAVVGTSGSGKSSLVRAGMIAELHGGTMTQAGSTWEIMILRPGGSPIENLARAMVDADLYDPDDSNTLPRLLATLKRSRFGLVEAMKQSDVFAPRPSGEGPGVRGQPTTNLLVVVDQFEELFRFRQQGVDSEETAAAFVNLLLTASEQTECPIYVTITMRSDYLGDCSQIPGLAEAVNEGEYLIPGLLRDQKRDAIEKPIGVGGAKISPLLVQRLLNEVGDDRDQLPVMQHALMRMWDAWSTRSDNNRPIDFGDFETTGGLGAALSNHADEIYASLPDDRHRSVCEKIFKTLTVKGEDNRGIRRPTRLAQLQAIAASDRDTVTTVLDAFRSSGVTFLMPGTEVELDDRTVLDLSHESLMRGWQRLRGWVEEEAQSARVFRRLLDTARLWSDGKAGLFRDPDLQIALSWREQEAPNTEWAEQYGGHFPAAIGFLDTSNAESEAERQAKEAARQHELEQARQLAEAQQLRLEQQHRAARRLRLMIAGLAVVAVLAVSAFIAALVANQRANTLAENARQNALEAQQNAVKAQQNADRAEQSHQETAKALTVVEAQKAKAETAELAARAAEEAGRKLLYTTDMQLAPFLWRDDRTTAAQLRLLLAKHIPESKAVDAKPDLRGFEWNYYQNLLENSAAVFSGHTVTIADAAFTSQGDLLTLDQNGQLRRWHLESQEEDNASRRNLPGGPSAQVRVLSPNGRVAALAESNKVRVFDTSTGKEKFQLDSANHSNRRLIFSRDESKLVIVDNKTRWCNAVTGEVIASVDQTFGASSLALSADGLTLAQVGRVPVVGFLILRLDLTTRTVTRLAKDLTAEGEDLSASALSPDGQRIAVGCYYVGLLFVFDTATGGSIAKHGSAHASPISAIAFSGDGTKLATADVEGTIKIWADSQKLTSKSTALWTLKGHQGRITSVNFSSDGRWLASGSDDKTARVWNLENAGAAIRPLEHSSGDCWMARFSADGQLIAAADGSRVRLWDAATGRLVRDLPAGDTSRVLSVAFSPTDNNLLATGHGGQNASYVSLWDIQAGTEIARLPGAADLPGIQVDEHTGAVSALAFSPDGKYLVAGFGSKWLIGSGGSRTPLKVWEVATRRLVQRLNGHTGYCVSLDFSPDGKLLASGSRDGTAIIWSTATWERMHRLQNPEKEAGRKGMVDDVAFSPDGKTLALASREGTVQLWDIATGKLLKALKGHSSVVQAVAFSPDGRTLASGGNDQTVRLWNVRTRRELMQLDPGTVALGSVFTLMFSPDGRHLLTGGEHVGAAFWSAAPIVWNDPDRAAEKLRLLLKSNADFQSRIRMLSENLRLYAALEKLDAKDMRVQAALAATRANWHAAGRAWPEAVAQFDRLLAADPSTPEGWLRTPGLLRLATALVHCSRPDMAAKVLQGGAERRAQDGFPAITKDKEGHYVDEATGDLLFPLLAEVEKRLAKEPRDAGLIELRAELAGHQNDFAAQEAYYTSALKILVNRKDEGGRMKTERMKDEGGRMKDEKKTEVGSDSSFTLHPSTFRLRSLYRRRGDVYLRLQKWSEAIDDYVHVITPETTDADLLSKRARAYEALNKWDAAAADWSRASLGNPEGSRLVTGFARRLAAAGQVRLANGQYERSLAADAENDVVATELAQLLLDKHENENRPRWTILKPVEAKSERGASLSILPDDSILASGTNLPNDRYRVVVTVGADIDLAAVRLDALTHASLPANGPGRYPGRDGGYFRGTFQQTSWKVTARSPNRKDRIALEFDNASAHPGTTFPIRPDGFWNIAGGGEGRNCTAIWSLSKPVSLVAGTTLTFDMRCGGVWADNLGHFRLSACGDRSTFERQEKLFAAKKITDPWSRLAAAYAVVERNDEALRYFSKALKLADGYEARKPIVQLAARFDDLLSVLVQRQPDDWQLQLAFARRFAERGKQRLAEKQPAQAQTELEKARAIYTRLLSEYPDPRWTVLTPTEVKSAGGATLTKLNDDSILASGTHPDKDTYTVVAHTDLPRVTAFRLEAMAHESLPHGGPGRAGNGNFHLNWIAVTAGPPSGTTPTRRVSEGLSGNAASLKIVHALADYEQTNCPIAAALDRNSGSGWAIGPQYGKNHWALFEIEASQQSGFAGGMQLTFTLDFGPELKHALGRFRLSVTDEPTALEAAGLRLDLRDGEVADVNVALAKAYAQEGRTAEAAALFTQAFHLAADRAGKARIAQEAVSLKGVAVELLKRQPNEPQLQLAWARQCVERGKGSLVESQPAQAQAELEKAREIFRRLLSNYPEPRWTVLTPAQMKSAWGATLTRLNDNSILASGENPDRDTYTVAAQTDLPRITAFRLEALAHESLPRGGPGRVQWGNFNLSEIAVTVGPPSGAAKATSLKIIDALADYEQPGCPVAAALGRTQGAWAIDPQAGKNHWAVFEIEASQQAGFAGGTQLTFTLAFRHDFKHALGRFRLSVTDEPTALEATGIRLDLRDGVAEVHAALAEAQAQDGRMAEAATLFTEAFHLAADPAGKARIAREAVSLKGVAENLIKTATLTPDLPAADWLVLALAHARLQETAQLRTVSGKVTALLTPTGADVALRPLLREVLIALGPNSPEATALLAAAAGKPPVALNEAIARNPDRTEAYRNRAYWFAERALWKEAGADLAAAFRRQPDPLTGMRLGVVLVQTGEIERYRAHCRAMLERWASTEINSTAERTLKTVVLVPDVKAYAKQLARLAEVAVSGDKKLDGYEWNMFAKGLHDYRTGNYADAVAGCRESRGRAPESKGDPRALASMDLAVEAMALHRLGDEAGARRALAEAKSHVEVHVPGIDAGSLYDWLIAHILYREAEGLIAGKKAEQPK